MSLLNAPVYRPVREVPKVVFVFGLAQHLVDLLFWQMTLDLCST